MSINQPKIESTEKLTVLHGFYGDFTTDTSYPTAFFQTVVSMDDIDMLTRASHVIDTEDFEELIQRDLDEERIKKIATGYLQERDKVLFFPPIIASVIATENGQPLKNYGEKKLPEVSAQDSEGIAKTCWGNHLLQLEVPYQKDAETGFQFPVKDEHGNINKVASAPYYSMLSLNSKKVSLIVIDGQHRLEALKFLKEHEPISAAGINIPVCIVFSPDAVSGEGTQNESVITDIRELFLRINNEGKRVSGHFLTLLDDKNLSAYGVRQFCQEARSQKHSTGQLLHLVEWNAREKSRSNQVDRDYSITSIGIISDVLAKYAFQKSSAPSILKLNDSNIETSLTANEEAINVKDISESNFHVSQIEILKAQMKEHIATPLLILFSKPTPYQKRIKIFISALEMIDKDIRNNVKGAKSFKIALIEEYRRANPTDGDHAISYQNDHFSHLFEKEIGTSDSIYRTSVFQQGLIRTWIDLSEKLAIFNISSQQTAELIVIALNESAFKIDFEIFESNKNFNINTLYKTTGGINVTGKGRDAWKYLVQMCMSYPESSQEVKKHLSTFSFNQDAIKDITSEINCASREAFSEFITIYRDTIKTFYKRNWVVPDVLDDSLRNQLEQLDRRIKDNNKPEDREKFEKIVSGAVDSKSEDAQTKLSSLMGFD